MYPVSRSPKSPVLEDKNGRAERFNRFVQVDQAIEILLWGKAIGALPC